MASIRFAILLTHIFAHLNVIFQHSRAQCTGSLTISLEPDIITAKVTNIGSKKLSLLRDNNVFGLHGLSMPFTIINESRHTVPIAWTHSMAIIDDCLDLAPGEVFERDFNLTNYMPEDMVTSVNISIALPGKLPIAERYSDQVDTGHRTDDTHNEQQSVLGSSSYAWVTLNSKSLHMTSTPSIPQPLVRKRQGAIERIAIVEGACRDNLLAMINAIQDGLCEKLRCRRAHFRGGRYAPSAPLKKLVRES